MAVERKLLEQIRPALPADYNGICKLVDNAQDQFLAFPSLRQPITPARIHSISETRTDLTVITSNKKIAGFANLYGLKTGQCAFIGNLIIASEMRGWGIGRQLVQYMLNRIFSIHELPQARISVFEHNLAALGLYTRLGFIRYASDEKFDRLGKKVTLLHMQKERDG